MAVRRNFSLRPCLPKTARKSKSVLPKSHYIYLCKYSVPRSKQRNKTINMIPKQYYTDHNVTVSWLAKTQKKKSRIFCKTYFPYPFIELEKLIPNKENKFKYFLVKHIPPYPHRKLEELIYAYFSCLLESISNWNWGKKLVKLKIWLSWHKLKNVNVRSIYLMKAVNLPS